MARRVWFGVCLIAIVAMLTSAAWTSDDQNECLGLYYVGDLFDSFGSTYLCAQVGCPCTCAPSPTYLGGAGVWFQVWDLWGVRRTNGAMTTLPTNSVGRVCDPQNFGVGVFEVQAFGAENGPLDDVCSPPVAVTVYNCTPGVTIAAGGALKLATCRKTACDEGCPNGPGGCIDYTCRQATFGLYYDVCKPTIDPKTIRRPNGGLGFDFAFDIPLPDSRNEQLLFLDPCNPDGAVKIKVRSFRTASLPVSGHINIIPPWWYVKFDGLKITGYCEYTVGDNEPVTKYFEATLSHHYYILSKSPYFKFKNATFDIRVWEYPNTTLYQACGEIQNGGSKIF